MASILGRKIGMTQTFGPDGKMVAVSVIKAGPCKVLSRRTKEKEGYVASVVGFEDIEGSKVKNKPLLGLFKKLGVSPYREIKELRDLDAEPGTELTVTQFTEGDLVSVRGTSKGKGFQGVIKRHGFSGMRGSHGADFKRAMGSAGMHTWPARVLKGKKMPGHDGVDQICVKNIEVLKTVPEENLLLVKGAVPGAKNGLLRIEKIGSRKK